MLLSIALPNENYTPEKIRKMYGSNEININFPTPIPVHITYQTAFVDDAGKLQIRDDIYGRDARLLAVLKSDQRKVADVAVDHRPTTQTSTRTVYRLPDRYQGPRDNPLANFFERLFR